MALITESIQREKKQTVEAKQEGQRRGCIYEDIL